MTATPTTRRTTRLTDETVRAIGRSLGVRLADHFISKGYDLTWGEGFGDYEGDELAEAGIYSDADDGGSAFRLAEEAGRVAFEARVALLGVWRKSTS